MMTISVSEDRMVSCNSQIWNHTSGFNSLTSDIDVHYVIQYVGIPVFCVFGIFGNVLNIVILTKMKVSLQRTGEKGMNTFLVVLGTSDLFFCVIVLPFPFLHQSHYSSRGFTFYYGLYATAVINIFILTSTWLTVAMATERYLAIRHPLKRISRISVSRTRKIILCVYVFSVIFNIPMFWRYKAIDLSSCSNGTLFHLETVNFADNFALDTTYRFLWAIIGNFLPFLMLLFFNISMCRKIHLSYMIRRNLQASQCVRKDPGNSTTITLVAIIMMFLLLVAPSETILFIAKQTSCSDKHSICKIETFSNLIQTINFSVNFLLYCAFSFKFRRTLKLTFLCSADRNLDRSKYITCTTRKSSFLPKASIV